MPRPSSRSRRLAAVVTAFFIAACAGRTDPIRYTEGTIVVENRTDREWRNVHITINDYFHGGAASLPAGGRLTAPISGFQTGTGQRFDRVRMGIRKLVVTASDPDGKPIRMEWDGKQMVRNET